MYLTVCKATGGINAANRIIVAVGEHIIAHKALAGGNKGIRIQEAAPLGVIIAGLEVIESCLGWVLLCTRRGCPLRDCFFGMLLAEKSAMHQQASTMDYHGICQENS